MNVHESNNHYQGLEMSNKRIQLRDMGKLHDLPSQICFMLSSEDFNSSPKKIYDIVEWATSFSAELADKNSERIQGIIFHLHNVTDANKAMSVLSRITELAPCTWYSAEEHPEQNEMKTDSSYSPYAPKVIIVAGMSGRQEIADTLVLLAHKGIQPEELTEEILTKNLCIPNCPDFVIKTRERHLVDFMIWQTAYSELYFTQAPLHAFTRHEFKKALLDYQSRIRKFGR